MQDLSLVYIKWLLSQYEVNIFELEEHQLGVDWSFEFSDFSIHEGKLIYKESAYLFKELQGVFLRFNPHPALPYDLSLPMIQQEVLLSERRQAINYFLNVLPSNVVNRPYAGISNASKPYQMMLLESAGFKVPEWVVTNDLGIAKKFMDQYSSGAVYKSCSGLRSHVRLADEELLEKLKKGTTPVILQEYIRGTEVRVHTVKDAVFPTKISSEGIDYRFDSANNTYEVSDVPEELAKKCCEFARKENLILSGFDFRVTADHEWYCLEMNPVPTFLPYEMSTGQQIGRAIVDELMKNI